MLLCKRVLAFLVFLLTPLAHSNSWQYSSSTNKLTDEQQTYAASPASRSHNIQLGFECDKSRVAFTFNTSEFIHKRGEDFKLDYRVDKKPAQKTLMTTYSNTYTGGYTYEDVDKIAHYFLGGYKVYAKVTTWNGTIYDATLSLKGSDRNIKRLFKDCNRKIQADILKENKVLSDNFAEGAIVLSCQSPATQPYIVELVHNNSKALIRIFQKGDIATKPEIVNAPRGVKVRYRLKNWFLVQETENKFSLHQRTSGYSNSGYKVFKCKQLSN